MIIGAKGSRKSFCHQCSSPKKVIELMVSGYEYAFLICEKCLVELSEAARNGMEKINQ